MTISVVIPCLGDRERVLERVCDLSGAEDCREIVVCDATPGEDWECPGARVVRCDEGGRGTQLNEGAAVCSGEVLLFNHADTLLRPDHLRSVANAFRDGAGPDVAPVGGAFHKDIRRHHPRLGWAEPVVRRFTRRWGILYGDQSPFVRRACFEELGGFAEIPLMEDVEFSGRLRKFGPIVLLDPPLETSMRRFRRDGYLRTKLRNMAFVALFRAGVSPRRLYHWYYGHPPPRRDSGITGRSVPGSSR